MDTQAVQKLRSLMDEAATCMLTTVDFMGSLRSRPMALPKSAMDGHLWFFAQSNSRLVAELTHRDQVNVCLSRAEGHHYLSISGRARSVTDADKVAELWRDSDTAWFPPGVSEADLQLLKVEVEMAEYWDSPSSAGRLLWGDNNGAPTGKRHELREHVRLLL